MENTIFTAEYWDDRYIKKNDIWSLNNCNPVLVQVLREKVISAPAHILVAGSGRGEDAVFLAKEGFAVTAADFSAEAVNNLASLAKSESVEINIKQIDLFDLKKEFCGEFDYIYEYVTICAVDPERIEELIDNFSVVLKRGGLFVTVLFPVDSRKGGPPFSIDMVQFYKTVSRYLKLEYFCRNVNSVKPRKGNEVLMTYRKER